VPPTGGSNGLLPTVVGGGLILLLALVVIIAFQRRRHRADPAPEMVAAWAAVTAPAGAAPNPSPPVTAPPPTPPPSSQPRPEPLSPPVSMAPTPPASTQPRPEPTSTMDAPSEPSPLAPPVSEDPVTTPPPIAVLPDDGTIVFKCLGPPEVTGLVEQTERGKVVELGLWLALHRDKARPGDTVCDAVWPDGRANSMEALRQTSTRLRRAVGAERFPLAGDHGGYQLIGKLTTDLTLFGDLVAHAAAEPERAADYLDAALSLVRGRPFQDVTGESYSWATRENWVGTASDQIVDAAHRLAAIRDRNADVHGARDAVRQGLLGCPDSGVLICDNVRLATDPAERRLAWEHAVAVLGAAEAERVVGPLYRRLQRGEE
jgi:hypothetical protein